METKEQEFLHPRKHNNVHHTLAHSYYVYFLTAMFGVVVDIMLPLDFFNNIFSKIFGLFFILFSSLLIFWAQHTSRKLPHNEEIKKENFCKGPYRHTRTPTHTGLFLLLVGFGFVLNTFFLVLFSVGCFIITRITYIKKQEDILHKKYGNPYDEYKKMVRF